MKRSLRVVSCAVVLSLLLVTVVVAAGNTGVKGRLWDSGDTPQPWQHGARVIALECTSAGAIDDQVYGCDNANSTGPDSQYGRFDFAWGTNNCTGVTLYDDGVDGPSGTDTYWVCLYLVWNDGGTGQPLDMLTAPQQYIDFVEARMNFNNIQSGTGATAITLANVTARSANFWLPVGLAVLSVLIVGALFITRRLRV